MGFYNEPENAPLRKRAEWDLSLKDMFEYMPQKEEEMDWQDIDPIEEDQEFWEYLTQLEEEEMKAEAKASKHAIEIITQGAEMAPANISAFIYDQVRKNKDNAVALKALGDICKEEGYFDIFSKAYDEIILKEAERELGGAK